MEPPMAAPLPQPPAMPAPMADSPPTEQPQPPPLPPYKVRWHRPCSFWPSPEHWVPCPTWAPSTCSAWPPWAAATAALEPPAGSRCRRRAWTGPRDTTPPRGSGSTRQRPAARRRSRATSSTRIRESGGNRRGWPAGWSCSQSLRFVGFQDSVAKALALDSRRNKIV